MVYKEIKIRILPMLVVLVVFLLGGLSSMPAFAVTAGTESGGMTASATAVVSQICSDIYSGDFDGAREQLRTRKEQKSEAIGELAGIVSEYEAIGEKRQEAREAAYSEQLTRLEKFRVDVDANGIKDVNDIISMLSVTARGVEFADEAQKEELLSNLFVKQTIERAIARVGELEAKGKWLEAYIYYSWLQAIDENNEEYSDHTLLLEEKTNIAGTFRDSPCETCKERYKGVEKEMFIRAINALHFNYVSIIDYREMAIAAIRRSKLMGEVWRLESKEDAGKKTEELLAWSMALKGLQDEVEQSAVGMSKGKFIEVFENVLILNDATVELSRSNLIVEFAEASLATLDRYTIMVWPKQKEDFDKTMTNKFTGIGIEITKEKGLLTVVSLLPDTPAYSSGLDAGDVIEKVDGVDTKDMTLTCAVRNITGPAGTKVALTVRGPGAEETREITITRARIIVPTARGWQRGEVGQWRYIIDEEDKIGYVRLTSFSERTSGEFEKVLNELEAKGLRGLILDLRLNSGGLLHSAVEIVDKFIEEGMIVSTRPRPPFSWAYESARRKNTHPNYPLVVLMNRFSASASEIVAGALGDKSYHRAVLVGERTHGKGSVQGISSYPGGEAQLKYTMAYYHLPSDQRVESQDAVKKLGRDDWGVGPDIEVKLRSDELKKMMNVQRDNEVLVKAGAERKNGSLKRHTLEETLAVDHQLAVGLLVIKSKFIEAEDRERLIADGLMESTVR
jgi:carboxyl-terminal processing protease